MNTENIPTPPSNAFDLTLRGLRGGAALAEASDELTKLVAAVRHTGKKGRLTLAIDVEPASAGDSVVLQLRDDLTVKMPRLPKGGSIFFAAEDGTLQRSDPRQKEFQLREVPKTNPAPLVTVGTEVKTA